MYLPILQRYVPEQTIHVRTATDAGAMAGTLVREIGALNPTLPLYNVRTLAEHRDGSLYAERLSATLLTLFGVLALLLSAVGLYGVLTCAVAERTRELGIGLTQGARPADLMKLVVAQGMVPTLAGLAAGLAASLALTRVAQDLRFGVSATDPVTFAAAAAVPPAVALLACWIPARRAMRMNPVAALRCE